MKNTEVRQSPIQGKGLFSCRSFLTGEIVEEIDGEIVLRDSKSKYAIPMSGGRTMILCNKVKFVNHSTNPNVTFNLKRWALIAIRDISKGEELTSFYANF